MWHQSISLVVGRGIKTFSIFKTGYEIFFDYVKLSSASVPRIVNDYCLDSQGWVGLFY